MSIYNEKRYFLKNANLLEEIHKSKLTYCCYTNSEYTNYDIICEGYSLVTPNVIEEFFNKEKDRDYVIIRVMTDEHVRPYYTGSKINLQYFKLSPFKHFILYKNDYISAINSISDNSKLIAEYNEQIAKMKEQIKENNRNIRFNKLNKDLQDPYKEFNKKLKEQIQEYIVKIKTNADEFSNIIRTKMKEVLRSHWKGDTIETGKFSVEHGRLTDTLVRMLILLVDQYAKSGNWSGYTYIEDMKSSAVLQLYDIALKFEESKSNNAFSYLTQAASMKFIATLNSEKTQRRIKSQMLQSIGYDATYGEQTDEEYKYRMEDLKEGRLLSENSNDITQEY